MADQPNLPAHLAGYQGRSLASIALTSIGSGAPPLLSIEGNQFNIIDASGDVERVGAHDPKIGLYVDLIIIDINDKKSKIYYGDKKYDPNNVSPPLCFSDNGIAPSTQAGQPQSPTCASCSKNEIGSAVGFTGKPVRACRDYIKAAIVLPQYPDETFLLRIPPNSFKHFRTHCQWFEKHNTPMETVVTRVYFEQGVQGTLLFHPFNYVQDAGVFGNIRQMLESKVTDPLVGRNDVPRQGLLAPPAQQTTARALPPPQETLNPLPGPAGSAAGQSTISTLPPPAGPSATSAPSPSEPAQAPRTRKRRTAASNGQGQPPAPTAVPQAALQAPQQAPFRPSAPPAQQGAAFGVQEGAAPNKDIEQVVNSLFGPPPQ